MAYTNRDLINSAMGGSQDANQDDYQSAMGGSQGGTGGVVQPPPTYMMDFRNSANTRYVGAFL